MNCLYCSASPAEESKKVDKFVFNKDLVLEKLNSYGPFISERENAKREGRSPEFVFEIWGGNPLFHFEEFKEVVDFIRTNFGFMTISTSDNGLTFLNDEIVEYIINNRIFLQLSHDGLGQWIRSPFDPVKDEHAKANMIKLLNEGLLTTINTTLSKYNSSLIKNIEFWNDFRYSNHVEHKKLDIKLNHVMNSDYSISAKNEHGLKNGEVVEALKGTEIGDISLAGDELEEFFHDFEMLAIIFRKYGTYENTPMYLKPFFNYIWLTSHKFEIANINDSEMVSGWCQAFQRDYHDYNFVIDTAGKFTECDLMDHDQSPHGKGGYRPDYCKVCKYSRLKTCLGCGSEPFPEKCEYNIRYARALEKLYLLDTGNFLFDLFHIERVL